MDASAARGSSARVRFGPALWFPFLNLFLAMRENVPLRALPDAPFKILTAPTSHNPRLDPLPPRQSRVIASVRPYSPSEDGFCKSLKNIR